MTGRLDGLFTPQKGHFSHFQPFRLTLSLPCLVYLSPFNTLPPLLSCSPLSRDADVQRRLRAWLLPELDCSAAENKAALNRPGAASALPEKCLTTKASRGVGCVRSGACRRIAYVQSDIGQVLSCLLFPMRDWLRTTELEGQSPQLPLCDISRLLWLLLVVTAHQGCLFHFRAKAADFFLSRGSRTEWVVSSGAIASTVIVQRCRWLQVSQEDDTWSERSISLRPWRAARWLDVFAVDT